MIADYWFDRDLAASQLILQQKQRWRSSSIVEMNYFWQPEPWQPGVGLNLWALYVELDVLFFKKKRDAETWKMVRGL